MKITCLGTGCPEPSTRRASSGYLVEVGGDCILFDCGGGVFDRLIQSGRKPSDITHLFFTHLHTDHMMDYARLVHAAWDEGAKPIQVIGPKPIAAITEKLFGPEGVFAHDLVARTENQGSQEVWLNRGGSLPRPWPDPQITEVEPGFEFEENGWKLTSCSVPHAQPHLTCMAFRVETSGKSFVYSGDAALCDELEELARDADLLIHWCYRMAGDERNQYITKLSPDPVQIAQLAKRVGVKQLLLTHFRTAFDTQEIHEKVRGELASNFSGDAGVAEDLMIIEL